MAGIKVVTDSMSDIPSDLLVAFNIDVVPLDVRLGTEDLTRATPEEFWRARVPPAPSPRRLHPLPARLHKPSFALTTRVLAGSAA